MIMMIISMDLHNKIITLVQNLISVKMYRIPKLLKIFTCKYIFLVSCIYPPQAAHRRQTLVIALFYSLWPRLTLFYMYTFNYYDIFLPFLRYHFPAHTERQMYGESERGEGTLSGGSEVGCGMYI